MLVGVVCWGFTPVILRRLTPFIDAWTANGVRYPISAVLYWPLLLLAIRSGRLNFALFRRCVVPAIFALGGQVFWALAFYELQASEVGFLVRLSMLWAVVGSMFLFRDERQLVRRPGFHLGVLLIVGGFIAMTVGNQVTNEPSDMPVVAAELDAETSLPATDASPAALDVAPVADDGNYPLGVLYILLCGAFFGCYMVSVRSCIPDVDPLLSFGVVANLVSVGTIIGMLLQGDVRVLAQQTTFSWLLLAASSFLGIALGHIMMFVAVQRLGAAITSSCQTLMPFVTAAAASVLLSESLSGQQWVSGSVMVVGAIVLLSLKHEISEHPHDQNPEDQNPNGEQSNSGEAH